MTGTIFSVQHYAVHDGPGIRTLVFLKGCPLRCSWCCNPESQKPNPQLRYVSYRCTACLECMSYCPSDSISVSGELIRHSFEDCYHCESKDCIEHCNHDAKSQTGKEVNAEELAETIALDIDFYKNSGGGVTFSGGEPMMQAGFLLEVLQLCKERGIHTAIETCGWAERKAFQQVLPFTDLFLFDIKITDPEAHEYHTGKPLGPILGNLAFLAAEKAEIIIRFPLVPGISDSMDNLKGVAEIMRQNQLSKLCLEPYHSLGSEKYTQHGIENKTAGINPHNLQQINASLEIFRQWGFDCETV